MAFPICVDCSCSSVRSGSHGQGAEGLRAPHVGVPDDARAERGVHHGGLERGGGRSTPHRYNRFCCWCCCRETSTEAEHVAIPPPSQRLSLHQCGDSPQWRAPLHRSIPGFACDLHLRGEAFGLYVCDLHRSGEPPPMRSRLPPPQRSSPRPARAQHVTHEAPTYHITRRPC